jgi:hypothetical protein
MQSVKFSSDSSFKSFVDYLEEPQTHLLCSFTGREYDHARRFGLAFQEVNDAFLVSSMAGVITPDNIAAVRSEYIYNIAMKVIAKEYDDIIEDNPVVNRRILKRTGSVAHFKALELLQDHIQKAHAHVEPENMRLQKKALGTYGGVPEWAFTKKRLQRRAGQLEEFDADYAFSDFMNMRWYRHAIRDADHTDSASGDWEENLIIEANREGGRNAKALANVPGNLHPSHIKDALDNLNDTDLPPKKRPVWVALAMADPVGRESVFSQLAEALQRASTYEIRKGFRMYRKNRSRVTGVSEDKFYVYSVDSLSDALGWIADCNRGVLPDDEDLIEQVQCGRQTNFVNWVRSSIRYHRHMRIQDRLRTSKRVAKTDFIKRIGPKVSGVPDEFRQIRTAGKLNEEGNKMNHCVGSYSKEVIEGASLMFHYDGEEGEATVEIKRRSRSGEWFVRQCYGKNNALNEAAKTASKKMERFLQTDDFGVGTPSASLPPKTNFPFVSERGEAKIQEFIVP